MEWRWSEVTRADFFLAGLWQEAQVKPYNLQSLTTGAIVWIQKHKNHLFCFRLKSCELLCNIQLWQVWWWKAAVWSSDTKKLFSSRKKRQEEQWAAQVNVMLSIINHVNHFNCAHVLVQRPVLIKHKNITLNIHWMPRLVFPLLSFNTSYTLLAPSHIQISWIFKETLKETDVALHADGLCASSLFTQSAKSGFSRKLHKVFLFFFLSTDKLSREVMVKRKKFFLCSICLIVFIMLLLSVHCSITERLQMSHLTSGRHPPRYKATV